MTSQTRFSILNGVNPLRRAFSIYEAKAKFSALLREVKEGKELIITERGKPIARIVPFLSDREETEEECFARLLRAGIVQDVPSHAMTWSEAARVAQKRSPAAVTDFLKERGRSWED